MHRQPTQIHANFQSVCIMTFQKLDKIVELLRSVGSKECLDDYRHAFIKQNWINRLLGKIDRRDSGSWGKIKRTLLSRQ